MLYRRSVYRPPSWAGGGPLPRGRALHRRSGRSRADCRAHRPVYGSWCSVRRASARSPGPRRLFLGAGAMLMGAHNGAVDHRIFVVGVCCEILEHPLPDTAFGPTAEPPMHLNSVTEPLRQIAPRHPRTITIGFCQPVRQLLVIVGRDGYARALCEGMTGDALPRMPIDSRQGTA